MKTKGFGLVFLVCAVLLCALCGNACGDEIVIPAGVKEIEAEAFAGTGAKSVTIPESVETISDNAFQSCASLTDVYLPRRRVDIAENAFDPEGVTFHVYLGTDNAGWAINHGYSYAYIQGSPTGDSWAQVNDLVKSESVSVTANNPYYTHRLIAKVTAGNELPALDQYNPKAIISLGNDLYVLQFENDTDASTCANALKNWGGCKYVEADYFLAATDMTGGGDRSIKSRAMLSNGINANDPMGFGAYVNYLGNNVGNVTIAVIDNGINANEVSCNVSSLSYDFINNRSNAVSGFDSHGTLVAQTLCDAFGSLSNHLTLISYRVVIPNNSNVSYILLGEAILQAYLDGADYINISIAGESTYSAFQGNDYLQECIETVGSERIIAAGGNSPSSVNNFIPAKYCTSVSGVKLENGELCRAQGVALDATYGGFATTTSIAAPKITAALALTGLDPDHSMHDALIPDNTSQNGMPNLEKLTRKLVERIAFTSFSNNETIFLEVGDQISIQYDIAPTDATNSSVTPVSNNESVMQYRTHDAHFGRFVAKAPGSAQIVFSSDDGNAEARLNIIVTQPPKSLTVKGGTEELIYSGRIVKLSAELLPANTTNQKVSWTSSNTSIAEISSVTEDTLTCFVTPVGEGDAVITATAQADASVSGTTTLHFSNAAAPSSIMVSAAGNIRTLTVGKNAGTVQMYAQVFPEGTNQEVEWFSDNPSAATIDINTGVVTAVGAGDAIITAQAVTGGACGFFNCITVIQLPTSVAITGESTIPSGGTATFSATVLPEDANNQAVIWRSENEAIATVDEEGVVTGVSAGTVTITAISQADETVIGHRVVMVIPAAFTVTFKPNDGNCATASIQAQKGVRLGTLPVPTRDYYNFDGWYTSASGGTLVTADTVYDTAEDVTLYAHWSEKPESGWVKFGSEPDGAMTTQISWSYRENKESTATTMSGWTANGSYWKQTGSGTTKYASFPSGFDTNHTLYKNIAKSANTANETATTKRVVSATSHAGYIYWHWMYNVKWANTYERTCSASKQWATAVGSNGNNYHFQYFFAFESTTDCPTVSNGSTRPTGLTSYNCASIVKSVTTETQRNSATSGVGSNHFLRFETRYSPYKDYQKIFKYYKDISYASADPGTGSNITNKVQYVKYREK